MTNECGRRTASSGDNTPRSTCWPSASYSRLRVVIRVEAFAPAQTNTAGDRTRLFQTAHRRRPIDKPCLVSPVGAKMPPRSPLA
jgi:hypothetical protein